MAGAAPTLAALRRAETAAAASSAMEQAVDRLIACESLSESQHLVLALQDCAKNHHSSPFTESLYVKLQQAAAICSEPSGKAQYLGFVLLQAGVHLLETLDVSTQRQVLLKVFSANNGVLSGYVAALTASDGPFFSYQMDYRRVTMTLETISPVLKSVLMDTNQSEGHKASVLDALSRIAWHFGGHSEDHEALRTAVARVLVHALELVPHSQLSRATYAVHVALAVDLLSSRTTQSKEQVALAKRAAKFVLESTQILMGEGEGVLALLQSLEQLAQVVPEALWCSEFLTSTAYFFLDKCETPMEQRLLLRVLTHTLEFGRDVASDDRSVYVEILLLPLSSMISLHGSAVSELLKLVMEIKSASEYRPHMEIEKDPTPTETATHARSAVRLISDERECQRWLSSLFQSQEPESPDSKNNSTDKWLALLLVALLSDERSTLRLCAANCLERQVSSSLKFWGADSTKVLVASLVFLVSQHPSGNAKTTSGRAFGEWVTSCLYSLAALAATTTDTMRIVLRLIDSMNEATKMRPMALKLMYEVWRNESRVFPRLETMLLEATDPDNDVERHVVNMATIKTLCEKDPELGVQFISSIQGFLEDELESVVSMAMDGITALCGGDCLDFYVAFKIIAQKLRKNKVTCADEPLFQERLCCFYALGGAESAANEKHASKLLDQAWGFADSEHPNVRKAAYAAMCQFPLDMLGLCMPVADSAGQDSDDDDQMTEEEIEEQLDDLMQRLHNEHDPTVRAEIENLVAKVIEHESTKLTAGVGRGQRMASAASGQHQSSQHTGSVVSAAATKEMKALLPSRAEVQGMFSTTPVTADWSGFLLTYQPKSVIDAKNVKRKDKLVRLATHNVDELVETVSSVLQAMELPWASPGVSSDALLRIQALMEGWRGFMATFASSLDELAELKTPVGVDDADVAFRVFSEAHVLCHFESFGGFPGTIQNQTKLVVEQIQETLEDESQQDHAMCAFMVSGIANFFHLAFGISGEFISAKQKTDGNVELTLDSNTIGTLVKLARAEAERKSIYSSAVLGAIARAADGFYVSQKKKSFDVEIRSVPTNTMLSKTLEWLRQTNPSGNSSNTETIADTRIAESLLACLTSTGSVLPLLDYSSFTHRVMLRFCSDGTSVACIRFAATQGSCDELLTTELLSSRWFANADTAVQAELIASLSLAATCLPTDVLRTLLINLFDILKDVWRRDTSSSNSTVLFDSWTDMLREVLTSTRRIPDTSLDMVNQVIREKMVVELPFGLQASLFVEQFATHVLSKLSSAS
ncbi:hypothetical protein PF010_g23061 [Phytophthora fragariae]|uniref:DUF3730 domain-containing protein n=1 Tax=Phytophthora fragariae TaxID=53985 RepID=A0A6G0K732_9STRA|nr:hypothetical protein PF010_g23061 [Phytophthora fragariae]